MKRTKKIPYSTRDKRPFWAPKEASGLPLFRGRPAEEGEAQTTDFHGKFSVGNKGKFNVGNKGNCKVGNEPTGETDDYKGGNIWGRHEKNEKQR